MDHTSLHSPDNAMLDIAGRFRYRGEEDTENYNKVRCIRHNLSYVVTYVTAIQARTKSTLTVLQIGKAERRCP